MLTLGKISDKQWKEIAPRLPQRFAPDAVKAKFDKLGDASSAQRAGDAWVSIVDNEVWVLRGASPKKAEVPKTDALRLHDITPDEKHAIVAGGEDVVEVDLETLASRVVFRLPAGAWALAIRYLAGDRAAISYGSKLVLAARGKTWREIATLPLDGQRELTVVRDRTILITIPEGTYGGRPPIAYAVKEDGLDEIARTDTFTYFKSGADELDGRIFVTDSKWKRHELLGLPGAPSAPAAPSADEYVLYGESPNDWYEGANLGHVYELLFREAPDEKTKAKLAKLYAKETAKGAIEGSPKPWLWNDRWALFLVGERTKHGQAFFEAVKKLMDKIHAIAPLAEVIFRGARADSTIYPRAPAAGPKWPGFEFPGAPFRTK